MTLPEICTATTVAPDGGVEGIGKFAVEIVPEPAEVVVGLPYVLHLAGDQFDDDDVVEIADDRYIVRQDIFRVAEIDEHRHQALALRPRQPPVLVQQHGDEALDDGKTLCDEIR